MNREQYRPVSCASCDWTGDEGETIFLRDAVERVAPGEIMPAGECPQCGAVAHLMVPRKPDGPYRPELAAAFREAARELCNSETGDRIDVAAHAQLEESEGGVIVHCTMFVSDSERKRFAGEEEGEDALQTCRHCGEERPAGPEGSLWTCGACNGLNEAGEG